MNAGCSSIHRKNGRVVGMPPTWYSPSARNMRRRAASRSLPQATSFEIIES